MSSFQDPHYNPSSTYPPFDSSNDLYPPRSHGMHRSNTFASSSSTIVKQPLSDEDVEVGRKEASSHDLSNQSQEPTPQGKAWYQWLFPKSLPLRLFLATVVLETIFNLAIQGDIFSRIQSTVRAGEGITDKPESRVTVFLVIFALAHVFQLVLAIDAVAYQNTLQFLFLTGFNFLFLVYSIIQAIEIQEIPNLSQGLTRIPIKTLTTLSHVIIAVSEVAFIALGWQIWREFGWKVYKFLGADIAIKRMFQNYQVFLCLIKFDLFFFAAFSVQLIYLVLQSDDFEFPLTIAALPLSLLLLVEAYLAARHENKLLMGSFLLGCLAASVYFSYKLFRIWADQDTVYKYVFKSLTIFAALSLFCLLVTGIWGIIVMRNFGRGLKVHLAKQPTLALRRRGTTVDLTNRNRKSTLPLAAHPNRMSIE